MTARAPDSSSLCLAPQRAGPALSVTFIVQGEGRGHLSQALAMKELLEGAGHRVTQVLVGGSGHRPIPAYFEAGMGVKVRHFPSPATLPGKARTGVSMSRTVGYNLRNVRRYRNAVLLLRDEIRRAAPDLVVNFYDVLGGIAMSGAEAPKVPMVAVGHQYLLGHPEAPRPPFRPLQLLPFQLINRFSAPRGTCRLALSFRALSDGSLTGVRVVPPLLRTSIRAATPTSGDHLLVYVINDGYGEAIARWQKDHPEVVIHAFRDRQGVPDVQEVQPNLTFHTLSDVRFLEMMKSCRAFVGTAGFESVAEAMWLGKPVMVVPTGNQVEQAWNAREAVAAGAGMASDHFDLTPFMDYLTDHEDVSTEYRKWVRSGTLRILRTLEAAARLEAEARGEAAAGGK